MLYIIEESAMQENEWWFMEAFDNQDEAKKYLFNLAKDSESTNYRLVEYKANKVIMQI